jgi:hypothetical protein
VRVRTLELRLLAAALTIGWAVTAGLILLAYRPGGPIDLLVGLASGLPIAVAAGGFVWPPIARGDRSSVAMAWLGIGSFVVLLPSIAGVFTQLQARGPQTLLPSVEAAYPWALALVGTGLFTGFGIARHRLGETALRRRRLVRGTAVGVLLTIAVGLAFGGVAIANEVALRDHVVASSRFGPTDPEMEPPACDEAVAVGPAARVDLIVTGDVDGRALGTVDVRGVRSGGNARWLAYVASRRALGLFGEARIGRAGYLRTPATGWVAATPEAVADAGLDALVLDVALGPDVRSASEMHGIAFFEGARARHCRIAIDGATFRLAFPQIAWLVGDVVLSRWRGNLDYWVFADGQLGRIQGNVSGEGASLREGALRASLRATMTMTDRARPTDVVAPTR